MVQGYWHYLNDMVAVLGGRFFKFHSLTLKGGQTSYVITIACIIGKTRLKGTKLITKLRPRPPKKPARGAFVNTGESGDLVLEWAPPLCKFDCYVLSVTSNIDPNTRIREDNSVERCCIFRLECVCHVVICIVQIIGEAGLLRHLPHCGGTAAR